jgi:hypothetical protein
VCSLLKEADKEFSELARETSRLTGKKVEKRVQDLARKARKSLLDIKMLGESD